MTHKELEYMKQTIMLVFRNRNNPVWMKAFNEYNSENVKRLGMGCAPCYGKVLQYHIWKNKNETSDE